MFLIVILFLLTTQLIKCDHNIHSINSIEAIKNGTGYTFRLVNGYSLKPVVICYYTEAINSSGWSFLSVKSYNNYSDELQAYFAGICEGSVTRSLIAAHIFNTIPNYCSQPSDYCTKLKQYLSTNIDSMITYSRNQGGYWKMIRLQLWQIKGLQDTLGNKRKFHSLEINEDYLKQLKDQVFGIFLLQMGGDLSALAHILNGFDYHATFPGHKVIGEGSCSAFIKYIKGDIYTGHVTWNTYNTMLRITKYYDFPYRINFVENNSSIIPGQSISFSSYPGVISSLDDFYITSGGLVTTETTIGNYNKSLWIPLKNQAAHLVFECFRVQTSNRLAKSGYEWSSIFAQFNSGTYNNQWMIVNYNVLKGHKYGMPIKNGALFVVEQIPGLIVWSDVSDYLRNSYWASYNIPFFSIIYKTGGFEEMAKKYGDFYSFDKCPRALIFKRDAHTVTDIKSFMKLMRYNDFRNDPLARCNCTPPYSGIYGISARNDLNDPNGTYPFPFLGYNLFGGIDMKFTNLILSKAMHFVGISSPTYDQQPAFDWRNNKNPSMNHKMQPIVWNFKPIVTPFP